MVKKHHFFTLLICNEQFSKFAFACTLIAALHAVPAPKPNFERLGTGFGLSLGGYGGYVGYPAYNNGYGTYKLSQR